MTVPAARLPADIAAVIPVPGDRRSIFVVPWPEGGLVYVGTTDTDYDGPLDDPRCTPEDVDYLSDAVNAATTSGAHPPGRDRGVGGAAPAARPRRRGKRLASARPTSPGATRCGPRRDGVVTVTGGKLTTYRKMAEDTMAAGGRLLPGEPRAGRCVTKGLRLRGAPDRRRGEQGTDGAVRRTCARPLRRPRRADVLALADGRPELLEPVVEGLALPRVRGRLRRPGRDGHLGRRRPVPPDPRPAPAARGERPRRPRGGRAARPPSSAGRPRRRPPRRRRFARAALDDLAAAGLTDRRRRRRRRDHPHPADPDRRRRPA